MKDDFRKPMDEQKTVKEIAAVINSIPENEAVLIFTYKGNATGGKHYTWIIQQGHFACFNPRVLYALNKIEAPQGDLYEVGLPAECRAAIKIVFNAMLFHPKPLSAWPSNLDPKVIEPCTTARIGVKAIQAAIRKTHPLIAHHFNSPERIGFKLLNIESNIVTRILLELAKKGVTALPFHDCVMVCVGHSLTARNVMEEVFERETGAMPVIKKTKCDLPRIERAA